MKLKFRQGIVRARVDAFGNPDFLIVNQNSGLVQINITNPTLLVTLAYKDTNFLIEEIGTVNAWGPFDWHWGTAPTSHIVS